VDDEEELELDAGDVEELEVEELETLELTSRRLK
jgi:hypothetical protein